MPPHTPRTARAPRPVLRLAALGAAVLLGLGLTAPSYAGNGPGGGTGGNNGKATGNPHVTSTTPTTPTTPTAPAGSPSSSSGAPSGAAAGSASTGSGSSRSTSHATSGTAGTSGDVKSPQPKSNADSNGDGANHSGPYDSTRDGSPSGNGNGGGQATGKPCAGCVGKADNKNPQGQYPGGSDHNKGYECDGNHGIGRTNPAHTGCQTTTPPTPPSTETCPDGSAKPASGVCPATVVSPPGTTSVPPSTTTATTTTTTTTTVSAVSTTPRTTSQAAAAKVATSVAHAVASRLPSTGAGWSLSVGLLAGLALLAAGATTLVRQRRRG